MSKISTGEKPSAAEGLWVGPREGPASLLRSPAVRRETGLSTVRWAVSAGREMQRVCDGKSLPRVPLAVGEAAPPRGGVRQRPRFGAFETGLQRKQRRKGIGTGRFSPLILHWPYLTYFPLRRVLQMRQTDPSAGPT